VQKRDHGVAFEQMEDITMTHRIVTGSTVLLACFLAWIPPLPAAPGPGHTGKRLPGAKVNGVETRQQTGGRDGVKDTGDQSPEEHALGLASAGHTVRHAMGSIAGLVRHPSGWDHGKKTGWDGSSVPPGLAKKQSLQSKVVHRAMFFRHGEAALESQGITRIQVANFDRFLDLNPRLERTLMQHPSFINNQTFLASQPSLTAWLKAHPQTAQELRENPQASMQALARFEGSGSDITTGQVGRFDSFLDSHPAIAQQLASNPALLNNQLYLQQHPDLQQFLQTKPGIRAELTENPQAFMGRERLFEANEAGTAARFPRVEGNEESVARKEVASFDSFLDANPSLAASLSRNPSLINNPAFLAKNPALATWLKTHPGAAAEIKENPQAFMAREGLFEANEVNHREVASFDRFLDANPRIAASLRRNPSLINNSAFLAKNPALATWLKAHPEAAEEIRENPQAFFSLEQRFEATRHEQARGPEAEEQEGSDDL